jgi:phosphoglycerol transferase MdoB-like AlkP superfamily enzyme
MAAHSILFPSLPAVAITELLVVFTIASLAYFVVFNNFEKHLPMKRRVLKLFIVVATLAIIGLLFSRYAFWGVITLMTIGQVVLHGWYFPKKGINGLTAEPYDKYLATIQEMKSNKKQKSRDVAAS